MTIKSGMLTVDLENLSVQIEDLVAPFTLSENARWRLLNGFDDISLTLQHTDDIDAYEKTRPSYTPVTA